MRRAHEKNRQEPKQDFLWNWPMPACGGPKQQRPGKVLPIGEDKLGPDEALKVDCIDIRGKVFPNGFPTPYIKGFVITQSTESLDVAAVYTTANLDGKKVGRHSSIDVEQIRERQIDR